MRGRPWKDEEIEQLVLLRRPPHSFGSIGAVLLRTPKACKVMHARVMQFAEKHGHIPTAAEVHGPRVAKRTWRAWTAEDDTVLREQMGLWDGSFSALAYRLTRQMHHTHAAVLARLRFLDARTPEEPATEDTTPTRAAHRRIYDITPPSAREWQERKRREQQELFGWTP